MYRVCVYAITPNLWRWEIRARGTLLRCGTAWTWADAEGEANAVVTN